MRKAVCRVKAGSRPLLTVVPMTVPVNEDAVEKIGHILDMAKDGTIDGVAVVGTKRDGGTVSAYAIGNSLYHLAGGVSFLQSRVVKAFET